MADRASSSIVIQATPAQVLAVIGDFAAYPSWSSQIASVEVTRSDEQGRGVEARFVLDAGVLKDHYTLAYDWSTPDQLSWQLVAGQLQKAQQGCYRLEPADGATRVTYELTVELAIPMLGRFKRKAEQMIIDTALKGLKAQVERGAASAR